MNKWSELLEMLFVIYRFIKSYLMHVHESNFDVLNMGHSFKKIPLKKIVEEKSCLIQKYQNYSKM